MEVPCGCCSPRGYGEAAKELVSLQLGGVVSYIFQHLSKRSASTVTVAEHKQGLVGGLKILHRCLVYIQLCGI